MYRLQDLKQVGLIRIGGGILALLTGIATQLYLGGPLNAVVLNHLITFVMFGGGWFLFNQVLMAGLYKKIITDAERAKLTRYDQPREGGPDKMAGLSFQVLETILVVVWIVSVVALQLIFSSNVSFALGALAAAWLIGGGAGKLRFVSKIRQEEQNMGLLFYFGDAILGRNTKIAYFVSHPEKTKALETVAIAAGQPLLPPGVKRRSGSAAALLRPGAAVVPKAATDRLKKSDNSGDKHV